MKIDVRMPRQKRKQQRTKKVSEIVVTVYRGNTAMLFDGDEESQKRMDRFARRMRANGTATIPWVLADNTQALVTADELEQALDLAMVKMGELWFL